MINLTKKMQHLFHRIVILATLVILGVSSLSPAPAATFQDKPFDQQRAKLLGFIVTQHLMRQHYNHAPLDDEPFPRSL